MPLEKLYLSNTLTTNYGGIGVFQELQELDISDNNIRGKFIPKYDFDLHTYEVNSLTFNLVH